MNDRLVAGGVHVRRRTLLVAALTAGVLVPFVGAGTAKATRPDEEELIPEESGCVPWW